MHQYLIHDPGPDPLYFSSKNSNTISNREKATRGVSLFLAWGDFHARSRFLALLSLREEKWGLRKSSILPKIRPYARVAL